MDFDIALGVIIGEGSFNLTKKRYSGKEKTYCKPQFQLAMDSSESELIEAVQAEFADVGNVSTTNGVTTWTVNSEDDLEYFRDILEVYGSGMWERSTKYEAFETWKKTVEIYIGGSSNDQERVNMAAIAKKEGLNVGSGGTDVEWESFIEEYADRNTYPTVGTKEDTA